MGKNKRWPDLTQKIPGDDFEVKSAEGEPLYPHAGEWVLMRQRISPAAMRVLLKFWPLAAKGFTPESANEIADLLPEVWAILSEAILDWSWTGPDGKPYPKPHKKPEVIANEISFEEMAWLVGQYGRPAEVPKNSPGESSNT